MPDDLVDDPPNRVDGDGEADAHGARRSLAGAWREDGRVDADKAAAAVEQWPAGVAWIDRCVSLHTARDRSTINAHDLPSKSGNDAGRQREVEPKRVADGDDGLSDE